MNDDFKCEACGYYRDTPNHDLGCVPFHNTKDRTCKARGRYEASSDQETCQRCVS